MLKTAAVWGRLFLFVREAETDRAVNCNRRRLLMGITSTYFL